MCLTHFLEYFYVNYAHIFTPLGYALGVCERRVINFDQAQICVSQTVSQSVSQSASQFVGQIYPASSQSVASPRQSFHLQSARPTHTHTAMRVHTIFKLGKAPTPSPGPAISNPIAIAHGLTRKQLLLRFRGGSAYVPRSVAEFSNLFFSKWFKALHVLGDDVSSSPNKLLMEIHAFRIIDFWAGRKLFLSLSLSIDI